jgi:Pentacotripeptide-repeat region of PRORP
MKQVVKTIAFMLFVHTKIGAYFVRSPVRHQRHHSSTSCRSFVAHVDRRRNLLPHDRPHHQSRRQHSSAHISNSCYLWSVQQNNVNRYVFRSLSTVRASPMAESLEYSNLLGSHRAGGGQPLSARERYTGMMGSLLSSADSRLVGRKRQRVTAEEQQQVADYLLAEHPLCNVSAPPSIGIINNNTTTNATTNQGGGVTADVLRNHIYQHRQQFIWAANFSTNAFEYCTRCVVYLGDLCAKKSDHDVAVLAWNKMREMGLIPREVVMVAFIYVLSSDEEHASSDRLNASLEAAIMYDTFWKVTEATLTLRVKNLVARGDVEVAEQLIEDTRGAVVVRLRTFMPLLKHYCLLLDANHISRIYQTMKSCDGVYLDADSYCIMLSAIVKVIAQQPTNDHIALFQYMANEMADDLLEIHEVAANQLIESVRDSAGFLATRVMISENATCPETDAKLRLFTLTPEKRRVVHDTLLDMAAQKTHNASYVQSKSTNTLSPQARLREFSRWLKYRRGDPYTAFIDGPNVAYFGHRYLDWKYIERMVQQVEDLGETPLVIMPTRYTSPTFRLSDGSIQELDVDGRRIIQDLTKKGCLYVVPSGSLDDYYWMLSSVAEQNSTFLEYVSPEDNTQRFPGLRPLLITNDQMRDHRLELLEPRLFRRWTSCHIVSYKITNETVKLYPAHFYSQEIQCNEATRYANNPVWHLPVAEWANRERLCLGINIRPGTLDS